MRSQNELARYCHGVCPSVCPSVCLGQACIVITECILEWISVYGWIVQCSGHHDTKLCPPIPNHLFLVPPGRQVYGCADYA